MNTFANTSASAHRVLPCAALHGRGLRQSVWKGFGGGGFREGVRKGVNNGIRSGVRRDVRQDARNVLHIYIYIYIYEYKYKYIDINNAIQISITR